MLILFEGSPSSSQALAVPVLPGLAGDQGEAQRTKPLALTLGGIFAIGLLESAFQAAQQLEALLLACQVGALDEHAVIGLVVVPAWRQAISGQVKVEVAERVRHGA